MKLKRFGASFVIIRMSYNSARLRPIELKIFFDKADGAGQISYVSLTSKNLLQVQ